MNIKTFSSWAVTIAFVSAGIYIGYKNHNRDGFWWGVLAILLIGSYLTIEANQCTIMKLGSGQAKTEV